MWLLKFVASYSVLCLNGKYRNSDKLNKTGFLQIHIQSYFDPEQVDRKYAEIVVIFTSTQCSTDKTLQSINTYC
jgi:hypothetical protein